jgi:hypothetical protein
MREKGRGEHDKNIRSRMKLHAGLKLDDHWRAIQ